MTTTAATSPTAAPSGATAPAGLLQRVILPRSGDPISVRSLYLDERTGLRLTTPPPLPGAPLREVNLIGTAATARRLRVTSRTTATVPAWTEVSFGAYFNAFAAGYWRRWSLLPEVHLR
ncbi:MAG: glycosyltransferase family 2 protein, partial [Pseudonocardia sp.]|nr:glycosyltransferase family 2 protein [Pseudonocardia sp.]